MIVAQALDDPISYLTKKGILSKTNDFSIDHKPDISLTKIGNLSSYNHALDIPSSVLKETW